MILDNNKAMQKSKFRFEEVDYSYIYKTDIFLAILQLLISPIYLGSWITFAVVRIPRVIISLFSQRCFFKINDMNRRLSYLKFEWIARLITTIIYTLVSIGMSIWLSGKFCDMFGDVLVHIRGTRQKYEHEC